MYNEGSVAKDLITSGMLMVVTSFRSGESESMSLLMHGQAIFLVYFCMSPIIIQAI